MGAGHKEDVPKAVRVTLKTVVCWQVAAGLGYLALRELLMRPFAHGADAAELTTPSSMQPWPTNRRRRRMAQTA